MPFPFAAAAIAAGQIFLPEIAKYIAGDQAGRVAGEVVDVIEAAAGVSLNLEDVGAAQDMARDLQNNAELTAEIALKLAEIAAREDEAARVAEFETISRQIQTNAEVAKIDAKSESWWQKHARPAALWFASLECFLLILAVLYGVIFDTAALTALVGVVPFISMILAAQLAVGGVYVWARHHEKKNKVAGPGIAKIIDDLI